MGKEHSRQGPRKCKCPGVGCAGGGRVRKLVRLEQRRGEEGGQVIKPDPTGPRRTYPEGEGSTARFWPEEGHRISLAAG